MNQEVVSFVLRFVREEGEGQPARWRGVIKHVQSDHTADFARFKDALQFMQDHVNETVRQAFSNGDHLTPENILAETTRLWGEMAPRYTDLMLQSMEVFLEQGRRMGETLAQGMASWTPPAPPNSPDAAGRMLAVIERLAAQVEALNAKVDELEARLRDE